MRAPVLLLAALLLLPAAALAAPCGNLVAAPVGMLVEGQWWARGATNLTWTWTGAARDRATVDAWLHLPSDGPDVHSLHFGSAPAQQRRLALDSRGLVDGEGYEVLLQLTKCGGGTSRSGAFAVDNAPPSLDLAASGERGADWFFDAAEVAIAAADAGVGVASLQARVDGGAWQGYDQPLRVAGEGRHLVEARVYDALGNEAAAALPVVIDAAPPDVKLQIVGTRFTSGWFLGGVSLNVTATDPGSGLASVELRIDEGAWKPYKGPVVVDGEGPHTAQARAIDRAGRAATSAVQSFSVDRKAPSVAILSPEKGQAYTRSAPDGTHRLPGTDAWLQGGSHVVEVAASDTGSGVAKVLFGIDGVTRGIATREPYAWTWEWGMTAGPHRLTVVVQDAAGWQVVQAMNVMLTP